MPFTQISLLLPRIQTVNMKEIVLKKSALPVLLAFVGFACQDGAPMRPTVAATLAQPAAALPPVTVDSAYLLGKFDPLSHPANFYLLSCTIRRQLIA